MTREEAISILSDYERIAKQSARHKSVSLYSMSIAALREQEERSKGCEFCAKYDDPCGIPMIATEDDEPDRGIYLYNGSLCADGGTFCSAKVRFCPMCGRKLEVDA